jgi:D-beta-D-heptose 7-phosphate kinase/D-beta-D-heptose 1-phosphate adenosyltransferase
MLDITVAGEMTRISPEAPVPVVLMESVTATPGGAANVARNIATLGAGAITVDLVGYVGNNERDLLAALPNAVTVHTVVDNVQATLSKTRTTVKGQQVGPRVDNDNLPCGDATRLLKRFVAATDLHADRPVSVVVVSDYAKGTITEPVMDAVREWCGVHRVPLLVDGKPCNKHLFRGATVITPNLAEAEAMLDDVLHPALAVPALHEKATYATTALPAHIGVSACVVTCGEHGAYVLGPSLREVQHVPVDPVEVGDPCGAGDTFMAALAVSCANGTPLEIGVISAVRIARIAVTHHGTYAVTADDVERDLDQHYGFHRKVRDRQGMFDAVARAREDGKNIIFTNGCFDVLHPGHLYLLSRASEQMRDSYLVVGINSDASVKRLKGETRPRIPDVARASSLSAVEFVDGVVIFDEDDPVPLIKELRPDMLVKGGEYEETKVPGANEVARWGGQLKFIPMHGEYSTTRIIGEPDDEN